MRGTRRVDSFLGKLKWLGILAPVLYVFLVDQLVRWLSPLALDHRTSHLMLIGFLGLGAGAFSLAVCRTLSSRSELDRHLTLLQEQQRLARELHDDLAQLVAFLHLALSGWERELGSAEDAGLKERVRELRLTTESIYDKVREVVCSRRIEKAPQDGFFTALRVSAQEFTSRTGIPIEIELPANEATPISIAMATHLLRIAREALCNIYRHSGATQAVITAKTAGNDLIVTIADNGRGFDLQGALSPYSQGLQIMRERAELVNGTLSVTTAPGEGTRVTVRVPLRKENGKWKDPSESWLLMTTRSFVRD